MIFFSLKLAQSPESFGHRTEIPSSTSWVSEANFSQPGTEHSGKRTGHQFGDIAQKGGGVGPVYKL